MISGKINILIAAAFITILSVDLSKAQEEHKLIRDGNKSYGKGKYADAEESYRKSLQQKPNSYKGAFNLGDAYYKQGKYQEAIEQFEAIANRKSSSDTMAKAFHNLGNSYLKNYLSMPKMLANDSLNQLKEKSLTNSVEAYKKSLKNNPKDEDARYNLSYASRLLKQQQQQNQQNKNDKNKDKNKDENKKGNENNKDKKEDKKDQNQQQQQQQAQNKISKEDAQRLLEASNNEEKHTQEKLKQMKERGKKNPIEKDW